MLRSMSAEAASRDATEFLDAARREREEAEQALAEQSAVFRSQLARADVGFEAVRNSLPAGAALVSFVQFDRTAVSSSSPASGPQRTSTTRVVPSYIAFVLRSGDPQPSIVELGASAGIDDLIARWRRQLIADAAGPARADQVLRGIGTQLRRRIWDPVAIHTAGVTRVLVIPDGRLNLLPIGALPADSGEYLVERQPVIHYLSAERDVVRPREPPVEAAGLLAIGGPAFGDRSSSIALSGLESRRSASGCPSFESVSFDSLPASQLEAESITKLWEQVRRTASLQDGARLLTGPSATERAFKDLSARKRILHLATHGFFFGDECGVVIGGSRAVGGLTSPANANSRPGFDAIENPLLLSGLALAGANRRATGDIDDDDGILTAEEVAALHLEGVEWAVLSACDTGLGTVASGEGVLGLRRAFQVAGVRTVIMSLWAVEDQAARQWMEALYRARLGDRLDTAEAVRSATLTVIADRRAAGRSTHPFYWASFVAAGDWR
jgi:CHAT domain-containing protein